MLRRRAFAEIHFRYALDLRRAAPVCKERLLRAYRLPDAACDLGEARGKGGHYGRRIVCRAVLFRLGTIALTEKTAEVVPAARSRSDDL